MKAPRFWNSLNLVSIALMPFSWLYRIGGWADRRFTHPQQADCAIISVGNATVGGTGKTPTVITLAKMLQATGATPHILTRGYKSKGEPTAHRVTPKDTWREVGDEALLLARVAPTWVGMDRFLSAQAAQKAGATILLADDAHQHHRLHKKVSFLMIDGPFGIGNGQVLPAGPLREPFQTALKRSDAVILIGEDRHQLCSTLTIPVFRARFVVQDDTKFLTETPWLAFAGIGRPEKFYDTLRGLDAQIVLSSNFPDHHVYTEEDGQILLEQAKRYDLRLITTEKDEPKLPQNLRTHTTILRIALEFEDSEAIMQFLRAKLT